MAWIPSIQQLGIRQLGSRELRKSWFENIRNSKVQEHTEGHDLKHHRLRSRGLRYVWIIWQNSFVGPKIERNWKNRRQQKKSRRMLSMNGIEEQFRCNKPYSKDIRRMNVVLIFPWCRTSGIHGNADFSTLNKKSRIFICNDTTVLQICRLKHTQTKTMAACYSRVPCMRPSQGTWDTSDSECFNLHHRTDSGTKIMAFQCEGLGLDVSDD